ncbi:MAG: hypothetical protein AB1640_15520 [bacterium]
MSKSTKPSTGTARRKKAIFYALFACLSVAFLYYVLVTARNTLQFLAFFSPEELFLEDQSGASIDGRKAEILKRLNSQIDEESATRSREDSRLLARLDQLLKSLHAYLLPGAGRREEKEAPKPAPAREERPPGAPDAAATARAGDAVVPDEESADQVLALAPTLPPPASRKRALESPPRNAPRDLRPIIEKPLQSSDERLQEEGLGPPERWLQKIEPLEGHRARGMVLNLNRRLALEGLVDASHEGETDSDLHDFGMRSAHAMTLMQGQSRPAGSLGAGRIDSGYPRSFGVGLNWRLSPVVNFLFDYSHESPNDRFIEYRESWESSLVTDYSRLRPAGDNAVHSFFFGLRYLLHDRNPEHLIPLQTGFFYATNMADEPISSDVSLGFSIGGGLYQKGMRLALAYRLRIWDTPSTEPLNREDGELTQKVSNQFLFSLNF